MDIIVIVTDRTTDTDNLQSSLDSKKPDFKAVWSAYKK